jgi:putative hydrolase of the HAD superfamily
VYILPRKTEQEYLQILDAWGVAPVDAWAVGNSVRSDINPALRVGIRAVWIARPTWLYEEASLLPGDVIKVHSLTDACSVILARSATRKTARVAAPTAG